MGITGKKKEYSYEPVSDFFIALSNSTGSLISNLKLQKLIYYADAWHLAYFKEPLIEEDFEAWVHGPAIPSLYGKYKDFGWKPIIREDLNEEKLNQIFNSFSEEKRELLGDVCDSYFGLDAYELERLTHNEPPWKAARKDLSQDEPSHNLIDKTLMREYYSSLIENDEEAK